MLKTVNNVKAHAFPRCNGAACIRLFFSKDATQINQPDWHIYWLASFVKNNDKKSKREKKSRMFHHLFETFLIASRARTSRRQLATFFTMGKLTPTHVTWLHDDGWNSLVFSDDTQTHIIYGLFIFGFFFWVCGWNACSMTSVFMFMRVVRMLYTFCYHWIKRLIPDEFKFIEVSVLARIANQILGSNKSTCINNIMWMDRVVSCNASGWKLLPFSVSWQLM